MMPGWRVGLGASRNACFIRAIIDDGRPATRPGSGRMDGDLWPGVAPLFPAPRRRRSEEHTSELQSLMRISYAVFCLKKKNKPAQNRTYVSYTTQSSTITSYTQSNHTKLTESR